MLGNDIVQGLVNILGHPGCGHHRHRNVRLPPTLQTGLYPVLSCGSERKSFRPDPARRPDQGGARCRKIAFLPILRGKCNRIFHADHQRTASYSPWNRWPAAPAKRHGMVAMPVPGPTMIIGTSPFSGTRKLFVGWTQTLWHYFRRHGLQGNRKPHRHACARGFHTARKQLSDAPDPDPAWNWRKSNRHDAAGA